jgi:hypothetical protein
MGKKYPYSYVIMTQFGVTRFPSWVKMNAAGGGCRDLQTPEFFFIMAQYLFIGTTQSEMKRGSR